MSESYDFDPGPWEGYNFASARAAYDKDAGKTYEEAKVKNVSVSSLFPKSLQTNCKHPVVIAIDVTASMEEWPATIFEKLPLLDLEGKTYLEDQEISFSAVGDTVYDKYSFQAQEFAKGKTLVEKLKKLMQEGGGGPGSKESYHVPALYYANNCTMPNAQKPLFIYIGDEGIYDSITKEDAKKFAHTDIAQPMSTNDIFSELTEKFSVYCIRKLFRCTENNRSKRDIEIQEQWEYHLGKDHVIVLPEPRRVVDVILGIYAKETNKTDYFVTELSERQTPVQVEEVMSALKSVHDPLLLRSKNSVVSVSGKSVKSSKLL